VSPSAIGNRYPGGRRTPNMSESDDESTVKQVVRTVTPGFKGRPDREMNVIGFTYFLVLLILLVPLLPFVLIIWLLTKVFGAIARRRAS
jgi:hypothetical protein